MNGSFAMRSGLVMALAAGGMSVALAQKPVGLPDDYPNKPVRIIVSNSTGGASDIGGRAVAAGLTKRWGSSVVVENIPGGDGAIGFAAVMRAPADGYTLLTTGTGQFVTAEIVQKVPYNVRTKFLPIAVITFNPNIVAVNNDLPVRNVKELIAYAKANPGKLNFADNGGAPLLVGLLKIVTGIDMQGIPYKGAGPAYVDQLAGRINLTVGNAGSSGPLVRSGKIRAIAVTSENRIKAFPDLPSIRETLPNFDVLGTWIGVLGLEGMSPVLINSLNREINAVLGTPEIEKMLPDSEIPLGSPEDFRKMIVEGLDSTARIVKQTGISP